MKLFATGLLALFLVPLSGCASIKPTIKCDLTTCKAEVYQGIMGIGATQFLPDADSLCTNLCAPR